MAEVAKVVDSYDQIIKRLESENSQLKQENAALVQKCKETDSRYASTGQENVLVKSEVENLRELLKKSEDERETLRKKVTDITKLNRLSHEEKDRKTQHLEERVKNMDRMNEESGEEIRVLTTKISVLLHDKEELKAEIDRLLVEMKTREETETVRHQLVNSENQLKQSLEEKAIVMTRLEEEQGKQCSEQGVKHTENLERENESLKVQVSNVKSKIQYAEQQANEQEQKLASVREELEEKVKKLDRAILEMSRFKEENRKLKMEDEVIANDTERLRDQVRNIVNNKVKLSVVRDQKKRLAEDCKDMKEQISVLTERLGTMQETTRSLVIMIKEKQQHNDEFISEIERLRTENKMLSNEADEKTIPKKRKREEVTPVVTLPPSTKKPEEGEVQPSYGKLSEENRRVRTLLTMKRMAEQNAITQMAEMELAIEEKSSELESYLAKQKRLQQWLDDMFPNKQHQLPVKDGLREKRDDLTSSYLPVIPEKSSLISPRQAPSVLPRSRHYSNTQTSYNKKKHFTRGSLIGSYSKKKHFLKE